MFLVMGVEPPGDQLVDADCARERGRTYLLKSLGGCRKRAERLAFFQDYLEDSDEMLARDAYDEFAKTPYAGVKESRTACTTTRSWPGCRIPRLRRAAAGCI